MPTRRATWRLERSFYNRLEEFASRHGVSGFHVILGALYCYFIRACHRDDLAVGLPILNRGKAAFKRTVGSFMSMSPAWFRLGRDLSFGELMAGIRRELRWDYRHGGFPVGELNRQLGLRGSRLPFELTFSYARHDYDAHFGGAPIHAAFLPNGFYPQEHGLFVFIEEFHRHEDVNLYFDYHPDFFQEEEIERLRARLEFLSGEALRRPEAPIRQLRMVADAELKQGLRFRHKGIACRDLEAGIGSVKELYEVTRVGEPVFDEGQEAGVCLIETDNDIRIELVTGKRVASLSSRGIGLYHV